MRRNLGAEPKLKTISNALRKSSFVKISKIHATKLSFSSASILMSKKSRPFRSNCSTSRINTEGMIRVSERSSKPTRPCSKRASVHISNLMRLTKV